MLKIFLESIKIHECALIQNLKAIYSIFLPIAFYFLFSSSFSGFQLGLIFFKNEQTNRQTTKKYQASSAVV